MNPTDETNPSVNPLPSTDGVGEAKLSVEDHLAALRAMESPEQRAKREAFEKEQRAEQNAEAEKAREIAAATAMEQARRAEKERADAAALAAKQAAERKEAERIAQAKAEIEKVKAAPVTTSPLRTLKTDLNDAVKHREVTATQIAIKEQSDPGRFNASTNQSRKPVGTIIAIIIFLLLGTGVLGGGYYWYTHRSTPITVFIPATLVVTENIKTIPITASTTADQVAGPVLAALQSSRPNTVTGIYFTETYIDPNGKPVTSTASLPTALKLLKVTIPDEVLRSLNPDFMIGSYGSDPFIILTTRDFSRSFTAMLRWEATIPMNLASFLALDVPLGSYFIDQTIDNISIRTLISPDRQPLLSYSFYNTTNLLIAPDQATLLGLIQRFK